MASIKPTHLERTATEPREKSLHTVTLSEIKQVNDQVRLFRLALAAPIRFLPGQWVDLFIPGISKAGGYTITSSPSKAFPSPSGGAQSSCTSACYLELAVQKSSDPPAAWLWQDADAIIFAELQIRIGGSFVWPPPGINIRSLRRVVFVAGGVGINPLMSMLSSLAENPDEECCPFEVRFLYSLKQDTATGSSAIGPRTERLLFLDRLGSIFGSGKVKGELQLFLTNGREEEDQEGVVSCGTKKANSVPFCRRRMTVGDVAAAIGNASERRFAVVYICGVPTMTDEFVQTLTELKHGLRIEPHHVLCEKWW